MDMKTYYANFWANNGTHYNTPITDTNKAKIISDIKEIAKGERFAGNCASWKVWYKDADENICVAAGYFDEHGRSHLYKGDELYWM